MKKIIWVHNGNLNIKNIINKSYKNFYSKIDFINQDNIKNLQRKISKAECLINCPTNLFNDSLLSDAKNIKWIHFGGAGVEKILIKKLINSNIILTNGKIIQGPECADHALALILYFTRNIGSFLNKKKIFHRPIELYKKKCGIIGGGGIGLCIAERLKSFGARIRVFDDNLLPLLTFIDEFYDSSEILNKISDLDIIISAAPLTKHTENLMNKNFFNKLKKDSIIINISRGKIINFKDLLKKKMLKKFKGIGLDVTDPEPLPTNHILRNKNNVIITNHTAGLSEFNRDRSIELICKNIKRYLAKMPLLNQVNKGRGY
jgi:D-2-hydroxyacid dehydrogenase (NADP+)